MTGLEVGADDYLTKPFSIRELIARVKALFRRVEAFGNTPATDENITLNFDNLSINFDNLSINRDTRSVIISDKTLDLTAKEFDLLLHFAENPGRVFSRAQLLDHVWGYGHEGYEHTVNSHINRLRNKIEKNPAKPHTILTV